MGALTSWNPLDLSRPVMGELYLFQVDFDSSLLGKVFPLKTRCDPEGG